MCENKLLKNHLNSFRTGRNLGKMKRGAKLRSFDIEEKEKFLRTCPCKVETWQRPVVGEDGKVSVSFAIFTGVRKLILVEMG